MSTYQILALLALLGGAAVAALPASESEYAGQFNYGQADGKGKDWVQVIQVLEPGYRSTIAGTTTITFTAPGMTEAEARCWHQPDAEHPGPWGYDAVVMPSRRIDGQDEVSFEFPADAFPGGPITIRIATRNDQGKQDLCELQLFNQGGVEWNQGLPDAIPPGAEGLKLVFADDFEQMPSISRHGLGTTYQGHKPLDGSQDFSGWRFSTAEDFEGAHDPFEQAGTWLRIKARAEGDDKRRWGTGIFSPIDIDGKGIAVEPPFYMECRFTAQSAPGTWPAFWTLTLPNPDIPGADELDIIEGYGGVGPGNPNDTVGYHVVTHYWGQDAYKQTVDWKTHTRVPMMELGGKSFWSTTFHTYGLRVDAERTTYYLDGIEVLSHPTSPISASTPAYPIVNYAIGGISGWTIDLARYGNGTDMWVDYLRVWGLSLPEPTIELTSSAMFDDPVEVRFSSLTPEVEIRYTLDGSEPTASSPVADGPVQLTAACTVKAIATKAGMRSSAVASAELPDALVATNPVGATRPGLHCAYHEGEWRALPDFDALTPAATSVVSSIAFPVERANDHFALRYSGYLTVPEDGSYTFTTTSDDGSQLLIDGQLVVDNDGLHGAVTRSGSVGLRAGTHRIEIRYFEAWGGESLAVGWSGPGIETGPIPAAALSCDADPE